MHRKKRRRWVAGLTAVVCVVAVCVCVGLWRHAQQAVPAYIGDAGTSQGASSEQPPSSEPQPAQPVSIHMLAVGDNLIHDSIYEQANARTGGSGYDFKPVYSRVRDLLRSADIGVINQETVLAGKVFKPSSYPLFNSPTEVGDAVVDMGFDVVNHANNHVLDKGVDGIEATLSYWDTQKDISVVGAYRNDEDLQNIRIVEREGIKTAHIGVTQWLNGLSLPRGTDYRLILADDTVLIKRLITKAKELSDVVVVSVHWGVENTFEVTSFQKQLAQNMVDWGADVIIGTHPHVLQSMEYLTRADGSRGFVAYSLGNFVSAQSRAYNMVAGILDVTLTKDPQSGKTEVSGVEFLPTVTHYGPNYSDIVIYPLSAYTDALASAHGVRRKDADFSLNYIDYVLQQTIPDAFLKKAA